MAQPKKSLSPGRGDSVGGGVPGEGAVGKGKGKSPVESFSYRSSELPKKDVSKIKEQNKAAETSKSKDLDAVERGKQAAETRAQNESNRIKKANLQGLATGLAGGIVGTGIYDQIHDDSHRNSESNHNKNVNPAYQFTSGQGNKR